MHFALSIAMILTHYICEKRSAQAYARQAQRIQTCRAPHSTLYTLHSTLQALHSTLYSTLHTFIQAAHSTLHTLHSTLLHLLIYFLHHFTLHNYSTLHTLHSILFHVPQRLKCTDCTGLLSGQECTRRFVSQKCST